MSSFTFDLEVEFLELYQACREDTMTSIERMYALYQATRHVVDAAIEGDFVECGVWRGGSVALVARTLQRLGVTDRHIWLYDTFEGMTPPGDEDIQEISGRPARDVLRDQPREAGDPFWGIASRALVEERLRATEYPMACFKIVAGDVHVTLPGTAPERVALLRLDTDWYSSTNHELRHLYPRLTPGGILLIDDYGYWRGARRATDEYLASLSQRPLLHRIDYTGRIGIKPAAR